MATYNPAVNDRSGEIRAAGLADAFKSFATYGTQGMQWGRDNRQRTEDMAFKREMFGAQQAAQEQQFAMANARDQQRFAMEMQSQQMAQDERKAMAAERKAESLAEADGLTAAVLQSFGPRISEEERARVAAMSAPGRKAWALATSKFIPQILEDERNQSPMQFSSPPGAPGTGVMMQGGRFMGSYSIPQSEAATFPKPDVEQIDKATGEMVHGWFQPGPDGTPVLRTVRTPGVVSASPRPDRPPTIVQGGQDKEGNPLFRAWVPGPGGYQLKPVTDDTVIPFGGARGQSPAPAATRSGISVGDIYKKNP
jgi:hypothetical protein